MTTRFPYASDAKDIDQLKHKIASIRSNDRHDLFRMLINLDNLRREIAKEELVCRRKGNVTDKYKELCQRYTDDKSLVDSMAMMALFRDL